MLRVNRAYAEALEQWRKETMADIMADIPDSTRVFKGKRPISKERGKLYPTVARPKRSKLPTVIHVNQHVIRANRKNGENNPPLTVRKGRNGKKAARAHEVIINGPSRVVHSPDKPLPCGARLWIETQAKVELVGD